jgi:S-adenosylmethionine synthetase
MPYLFTSESVSEGHPDKVADQISDALLDEFLSQDQDSKVAVETMVTTGLVVVAGEVKTHGYVDVQSVVRKVIGKIGYTNPDYQFEAKSCGVLSAIHEQSPDIRQGVDREKPEDQGAGDQGMMFGYASKETDSYMPMTAELSHRILMELAEIRREGKQMTYLRPDSKSQVTLEYNDDHTINRIHTIVVSTQHDEDVSLDKIKSDVLHILLPRLRDKLNGQMKDLLSNYINESRVPSPESRLYVNPTGKFVIGGPHGDTGLTGRKIVVDTYGGKAPHGGGAFSGKDPSKVDRSAAYAARHIAKNLVAAGVADEVEVQLAYAIGVAQPVSVFVNTFGTAKINDASVPGGPGSPLRSARDDEPNPLSHKSESSLRRQGSHVEQQRPLSDSAIAEKVTSIFDLRPYAIVTRFGLKNPIYSPTAAYGHFGRKPYTAEVKFGGHNGEPVIVREVEFFAWEKLDYVDAIKEAFNIS